MNFINRSVYLPVAIDKLTGEANEKCEKINK